MWNMFFQHLQEQTTSTYVPTFAGASWGAPGGGGQAQDKCLHRSKSLASLRPGASDLGLARSRRHGCKNPGFLEQVFACKGV